MLYLIGGAARAGKSTLARRMLVQDQTPYYSLDYITSIFHNGAPELGISHYQATLERAELLWPRIEVALTVFAEREPNYLIDGEAFLPKHISGLLDYLKDNGRACFFGYAEADANEKFQLVKSIPSEVNDWVSLTDDNTIKNTILESIEFSRYIRDECAKYDLAYFDTSHDFDGQIEAARRYLLQTTPLPTPNPAQGTRPARSLKP